MERSGRGAYFYRMRPLLLSLAILAALTGGAMAYCPIVADDAATHYVDNQNDYALCKAAETSDLVHAQAQQAQVQSAIEAQQQDFDLQLRLQQTYDAATTMPSMPAMPQF